MTGKLLPFDRPVPREPAPATPVQEPDPGDCSFTIQIDTDELARAIVRETEQLEEEQARGDEADAGRDGGDPWTR